MPIRYRYICHHCGEELDSKAAFTEHTDLIGDPMHGCVPSSDYLLEQAGAARDDMQGCYGGRE